MLFRVYSRYVPNLTRQDGSAMDRLLKQHINLPMAVAGIKLAPAESAANNERAQPPPLSPRAAA